MRNICVGMLAVAIVGCGGGSSTTTTPGTGGVIGALDGTWDVSQTGESATGAGSNLVVANDSVKGAIIDADEGTNVNGCRIDKYRTEVDLKFSGDVLSGTLTSVTASSGQSCIGNDSRPTAVTGSRTNAGSGLDGDWEVTVGDVPAFIVTVTGSSAKIWDKKQKQLGRDATMTAAVAGSNATTAGKREFGFAARKR